MFKKILLTSCLVASSFSSNANWIDNQAGSISTSNIAVVQAVTGGLIDIEGTGAACNAANDLTLGYAKSTDTIKLCDVSLGDWKIADDYNGESATVNATTINATDVNATTVSALTVNASTVVINAVATANANCSPSGRIAKDSTGAPLFCVNGKWASSSSSSHTNSTASATDTAIYNYLKQFPRNSDKQPIISVNFVNQKYDTKQITLTGTYGLLADVRAYYAWMDHDANQWDAVQFHRDQLYLNSNNTTFKNAHSGSGSDSNTFYINNVQKARITGAPSQISGPLKAIEITITNSSKLKYNPYRALLGFPLIPE